MVSVLRAPPTAPFDVTPLTPLMAAEVTGLDLARPLDALTRDAVYAAFLRYKVLVFRDQTLSKQAQIDFTTQFGELEKHMPRNTGAEISLLHEVTNLGPDGQPNGCLGSTRWHSDKSFRPQPSMATILHAVELPASGGGDTCFANMAAAWDALPEAERAALMDVGVVHSWELSRDNVGKVISEAEKRDAPPMTHPLARPHPDTGRRALFMGMHASHLDGLPVAEGRARIEALEDFATADRFVYRHQWRVGDVLMWDNRCLLHRADTNFDVANERRVLHRTCLRGTATG